MPQNVPKPDNFMWKVVIAVVAIAAAVIGMQFGQAVRAFLFSL
jgi:hypothetical protein